MDERASKAADRLYTVPPGRFVAERSAAVAAARTAGDRDGAAALAKLRRPSVAAWLVNLLAQQRPELVGDLGKLAEVLQAAQRRLDGAALRELTAQRRATVAGLVAEAKALAVAAEPQLAAGKLPLAEVEATLQAALADPAVAEQVRAGRLVRPATPAGFGAAGPSLRLVTEASAAAASAPEAGAVTPEAAAPAGAAGPVAAQVARQQAEAALGEARSVASVASAELDSRTSQQQAAQQELLRIDAELDELMARRSEAAERLAAAERASFEARRAAAEARRRVEAAEATLAALAPESDPG